MVAFPVMHEPREAAAPLCAHLKQNVTVVMGHTLPHPALIVYDTRSDLARLLRDAYQSVLGCASLSFYEAEPGAAKAAFQSLPPQSLVVLLQSESFQLPDYRIRVALADAGVKVIAHSNLARIDAHEIVTYIDSLAYEAFYYRNLGHALKAQIDSATSLQLESGEGAILSVNAQLEPAKLNIGDFTHMKNVASQFPIGEVFTEATMLEATSGTVRLYAFADLAFCMQVPERPIVLHVHAGKVTHASDSCAAFDRVLEQIAKDDGGVLVRELGFGLNRAFSREKMVRDVGAFERVCGMHLSLGSKHGVYKKPGIKRNEGRHHVDVFPITERVLLGGTPVYEHGAYCVGTQVPS